MGTNRKKLSLNVDELKVEAFATTDGGAVRRGTVHGRITYVVTCTCGTDWEGCSGAPTCEPAECMERHPDEL
jgi:hypothetical protein